MYFTTSQDPSIKVYF